MATGVTVPIGRRLVVLVFDKELSTFEIRSLLPLNIICLGVLPSKNLILQILNKIGESLDLLTADIELLITVLILCCLDIQITN